MTSELDAICNFLKDDLGYEGEINPEIDLLEKGILDSFNIVEVALFIQQHFGIELQNEDITRENFSKLSDMVSLIDRRKACRCSRCRGGISPRASGASRVCPNERSVFYLPVSHPSRNQ